MSRGPSQPNPALERLGFARDERVAIIHADDIGLCDGALRAFAEIFERGFCCSGSAMAPAPGFSETAAWAASHPQADLGLHLTLTSEWPNWPWKPLSCPHPREGLTDRKGFLHGAREMLSRHARPEAARREMEAQITRADAVGMSFTHLDTHMYAATEPKFLTDYLQFGRRRGVPVVVSSKLKDRDTASRLAIEEAEADGLPVFEHIAVMRLRGSHTARLDEAKRALDRLPIGLSCLLAHPNCETAELKSIVPLWEERVADFDILTDAAFYRHAAETALRLIRFDDLRQAMAKPRDPEVAMSAVVLG